MDFKNKKVLITGGTAGIGKALVKELAEKGVIDIAVIARRKEPMEQLRKKFQGLNLLFIQGDMGRLADIEHAADEIKKSWGSLDILINNAGVVSAALLDDLSDEDIINQININLTGLILMTKKMLPLLKESEEGAIVNVSSGLGYIAQPFYNVYAATKAGVRQFSDAMTRELFDYPIHVMTIYPTATDTPMMKNAIVSKMDTPEFVAKGTVEGLVSKKRNVIFGGDQRIKDIQTNFNEPEKIDEKSKANFEVYRDRTKDHRAM